MNGRLWQRRSWDNADVSLDSSKSADSDGDGVGDDAEDDLDGGDIPDVDEDSDEDGLSDDENPSNENSTGGNEAQPASGETTETGIWDILFLCCLLPLLLLFGPMLASSFRTGFTSTANLEVQRAKREWPIWNTGLPDEAYEGKWAVVDKNGVFHSSHRRRRDAVEAMVTEESFSLQGGDISALRAVDSEVSGESELDHEADDAKVDLADDAEELARLTGRKVEDVRADLADDGILNMSAGSDTKTKDDELIDSSRFDKVRKLRAEGGMAEVYQGKDKRTGERVIWKQAAPSRKLSVKEANRALANEGEVLERLDHPRIPEFIESGYVVNEEGDRVLVLIMEHIDGGSLDDEMKTFVRRGKTQDLDYVIETVAQCCDALEHMADLDPPLYHRDIKPHNIMTHPEGVVLIDFGLAKGLHWLGDVHVCRRTHGRMVASGEGEGADRLVYGRVQPRPGPVAHADQRARRHIFRGRASQGDHWSRSPGVAGGARPPRHHPCPSRREDPDGGRIPEQAGK